ncbi:MAG TPA: hypothetical protein VH134_02625 [Candidatus Dormibacteraeota bacterium]|jgi:hypothetical protein|nr:hypothetical protein [Candidatus Dormibacteraeota bacterium]
MTGDAAARQRRAWRVLVALQLAALVAVAGAVAVVWLLNLAGGDFGAR